MLNSIKKIENKYAVVQETKFAKENNNNKNNDNKKNNRRNKKRNKNKKNTVTYGTKPAAYLATNVFKKLLRMLDKNVLLPKN